MTLYTCNGRGLRVLIFCCVAFFLWNPVVSISAPTTTQTSKPTTDASSIEASIEAIKSQIKRIETNPDIKDDDKKELIKMFNQALSQVQLAGMWVARGDEFEKQRLLAPVFIADAKEKLEKPITPHVPNVPSNATLALLEQKLNEAQVDLAAARKKIREFDSDAGLSPDRRLEIPRRLTEVKQRIEEIRQKQKAAANSTDPIEYRIAKRTLLRAQRRAAQDQADTLETEQLSFNARMELFQLRQKLAERDIKEAENQVTAWRNIVDGRRKKEAARAAEEARRKVAHAIPEVRSLAAQNAELAEERNSPDGPVTKMANLKDISEKIQKLDTRLSERFDGDKGIKKRVEKSGVNKSISILLRKERINLPDSHELSRRIKIRQIELDTITSRTTQLQEDLDWYADQDARLTEIMGQLDPTMDSVHRLEVEDAVKEQLKCAYEYRLTLLSDYNNYFDQLFNLNNIEESLVRKTEAAANYIDEHIFWFPSTGALFSRDVPKTTLKAIAWFYDPDGSGADGWSQVAKTFVADFNANPILYPFVALIFLLALVIKHRTRSKSYSAETQPGPHELESLALTLKLLLQTFLMATIWPALIFFIVWQITLSPNASDFTKALAAGLYSVAVIFLTLEILKEICLPHGIAERHFRWNAKNSSIIRKNLYWLMAITLPAVFIISTLEWESYEDAKDSLGRIVFILALLAFAIFMQRVLGPLRHAIQRSLSNRWEGWGTWTHYVWYPLAAGIPAMLAVLAAVGYYYTARELAWRMLATLWLLMGMLIVREVLLRWIFLANRKIAIKRAQAKKLELHPTVEADHPAPAATPEESKKLNPPAERELNIATISVQARKLLDSFVIFVLAIALWRVWDDVLPALAFLKELHPWGFKFTDTILALVIVFMTYVAGKNIPGLLEITILPKLPLDLGLRFAITKVTRYLIIITGTIIAFKTIGFGWADIQWLVAAMTVGLSFGLQEIFANFISGLIILFERPMRVGDIVTVGTVSGTVTRIQIRATTIIDGENKEMIVPNKEFITGRLINWTLTDRILKLSLPVEIAYGSDTDLAQRLLLKVAQSNPHVLQNYSPSAAFTGFGQNGIHFELGVHTTVENYGILRHELNTAINRAFSDAGIQIPIPQQEIHVRARHDLPYMDPKLGSPDWPKIPNPPSTK